MPTIPEATLASWTKPAFDNEDEKRDDTERTIREAIRGHAVLKGLPINVYAKGSFKNNTNVRRDSDVDVAVELTSIYFPEYADGVDQAATGFQPYDDAYDVSQFKDHVGEALRGAFGSSAVRRATKVFVVREGSRNLAADVIPCFTYRWYSTAWSYDEGCAKNGPLRTAKRYKRYKRSVRILKRLENKMVEDGASPVVASYLIESLVFNVSDSRFCTGTWAGDVRNVLVYVWENTEDIACEQTWTEANGIKFLFHPAQKWTRQQARDFVYAAWQYVAES